ncbi:MAG: hypothetical protein A2X45_18995 [Lentisphaerae bacterium GWF2_50_93]|nr:MAG: hypothetical protein A2X45_18995 [Lentisphaerae bacterium GWF2_50_93]
MTDKIYNLSEFYKEEDTLVDKERARTVFFTVVVFHVLFIAGPFLIFALWEKFYDKKPLPMQVNIVLTQDISKLKEPPGKPPEQPKDEPKNTKKDEPQTEEEAIPEPPVKIPKKPVPEPPVPPEPKIKIPAETKTKPVVKPPDKEPPKDPPKEWKPKKPSEIIPSSKVVKGKPPTPRINATSLADKLKSIQNQCKITSTNTGVGLPGGVGTPSAAGNVAASYYDQVTVFLYDMWQQPSKADVKNQKPTVTIHIAIDSAGNVKSARIVRKSGIPAMDASVEELLSRLKTLPRPPQGADEFDALLGTDDN